MMLNFDHYSVIIMSPTLKKIVGHIASGLSVCSLVMLSGALYNFRTMYANVLKFHIWIPHEKIGDPYFFLTQNYLPF